MLNNSTMVNMKVFPSYALFILSASFLESNSLDTSCQDWEPFKDEKCFKILDDTFRTFADAELACAKLDSTPTLPVIHSKEEQDFLSNFLFKTNKKLDNFWIGAKHSANSLTFKWSDNSDLGFTNWDAKGPRNKANYCIQMQADEESVGKWFDEPCEKKNAVVCQKMQTWSLARLQKSFLDSRKELRDSLDEANMKTADLKNTLDAANKKTTDLKNDLDSAKTEISTLKHSLEEANNKITKNQIPIGFIYAQVPNEKSPVEIWPWMTWTDISATYAGVFFRITGGDAAAFGQVQAENCPQVTGFTGYYDGPAISLGEAVPYNKKISEEIRLNAYINGIKFDVTTGEVRPRNMAIRIWKRTG